MQTPTQPQLNALARFVQYRYEAAESEITATNARNSVLRRLSGAPNEEDCEDGPEEKVNPLAVLAAADWLLGLTKRQRHALYNGTYVYDYTYENGDCPVYYPDPDSEWDGTGPMRPDPTGEPALVVPAAALAALETLVPEWH